MQNFIYHNSTKVVFGKDSISKLSSLLPNAKIMLIYGGGSIKHNGVYQQLIEQLEGHDWCEFSGIEPNPEFETLMKAVSKVKTENVEFILAVGGGSVIDGAKFVAAATHFEGDPWDILAKGKKVNQAINLACVLTLPATGTETNTAAVVTRREYNLKLPFMSEHVRPKFAVLDPQVTYSLPERQLANGVVDAFVHVIEQYLTYPVNASVQDRFAESILSNLIDIGPRVLSSKDYDLRANLMWNATQALSGLIGVGVPQDWSTHTIGHELTALHNLDHAVTLAIILPRVMHYQREHKREKLLQYAERVWGLSRYDEEGAINLVIEKTEQFFRDMGIKTTLSEYNIDANVADEVASRLEKTGATKIGERQNISPEDVKNIVSASL
ncbi:iron-containing alcohol dehydrogenase [Aliiglaciecola aliphaticivorans]